MKKLVKERKRRNDVFEETKKLKAAHN